MADTDETPNNNNDDADYITAPEENITTTAENTEGNPAADGTTSEDEALSIADTFDINELASLSDEITEDFIAKLQSQVSKDAVSFRQNTGDNRGDSGLFEEIKANPEATKRPSSKKPETQKIKDNLDQTFDDNFIKKYRARLKQQNVPKQDGGTLFNRTSKDQPSGPSEPEPPKEEKKNIETLTGGNISEKPADQESIDYNNQLDLLDDNVLYSKYVIYVNPENREFIESLTVKERKNLINEILKEQNDIRVAKRRMAIMQTIVTHLIVSALTILIAIPVIYGAANYCLESTINNQRQSQTLFKALYKEHGKITRTK